MSNVVVPQCTHVKTNGEVCGSPVVSGAEFCYHHSAVKTALAKGQPNGKVPEGGFAPIPFVFPEDRASMQINFFLLLQAFNEQRIDQRTYRLLLSMLKAMARNLGKTGSLVDEASDPRSAVSDQAASPSTGHVERSETSAVSLSAAADSSVLGREISAGSLVPESCFSTNPKVQSRGKNSNIFRTSTLDLAGHGFHQAARSLAR